MLTPHLLLEIGAGIGPEKLAALGILVKRECGGEGAKPQALKQVERGPELAGRQRKQVVDEGPASEQIDGSPFQPASTGAGHGKPHATVAAQWAFDAAMHDIEKRWHLLDLIDHDPFHIGSCFDDLANRSWLQTEAMFRGGVAQIEPNRGAAQKPFTKKR